MTKKFLTIIILISIFSVFIFLVLRESHFKEIEKNKLQITTSFYPMYFFAKSITGDKANIVNITPAGAEPHDYELTTENLIQIKNSQLLILNGEVEPWAKKIKTDLQNKNTKVLEVGDNLLNQKVVNENGQFETDPHIWLSPVIAKEIVNKIAEKIVLIDPANQNFYQDNKNKLEFELDKLDSDYKKGLKNCNKKDIITSHAAFGYLAKSYGLNQIPIAGLSPDAEPSLKDLTKITNFAKANNVKYIFFESLISPKLAQTLADEVGAKTLILNPLEGLNDNDLKVGKTYLTEMYKNLQNLRVALECK
jgi:zinc transport system substrate-binding protein